MRRSIVCARIGLSFALLACALANTARARAPDWTLVWRAPAECPSAAIVRHRVAMWLEQSIERSDPRGMRVEATVQRAGKEFVLDLLLATSSGRARERLRSNRCETLANVIALKVSLAAGPGGWFSELTPEEPYSLRPRVGVRLAGSLSSGLLPAAAPAIALTGILRIGRTAVEVGGLYGFATGAVYADRRTIGADLDAWLGSVRFCGVPELGAVEIPICGGFELGSMRGVGFGVRTTFETSQLFGALALSPGLRPQLVRGLYAYLGFDLLLVFERPRFYVRNLGSLWESNRFNGRIQLGVEVRFE